MRRGYSVRSESCRIAAAVKIFSRASFAACAEQSSFRGTIPPGVPNNTVLEILEPAEGITVKAPSDLNNKTELPPVPGPDSPR